jgi:glutamate-ammonia-ligase adenylyltransferase
VSERDLRAALAGILPAPMAEGLAGHVARLADPGAAVRAIETLAAARGGAPDPVRLRAVATIAGSSPYLGSLLLAHPELLDALPSGGPARGPRTREDLEEDLARFQSLRATSEISTVLRHFKQREYLRIALDDFLGTADLPAIMRALSLLADVLIDRAVRTARSELERRFGRPTSRDDQGHVEHPGFVVVALGKLGGEELNYSSDIDLLYLFGREGETSGGEGAEGVIGNKEFFTRLARDVTRLIGGSGPEGQVFRVDLGLRPGGRDGDLVISVGAAAAYYRNWAQAWERQALIKARPSAGDLGLGRRFTAQIGPLVYPADPDPYLMLEIGAMKDRIDAQLSAEGRSETDVKLGRGGIRELEFAVQALQIQHGGRDPWLRQGNTLLALHRLAERGRIGYAEYATLAQAYTFLRDLEHRLQLGHNRQTATLPAGEREWALMARRMRLDDARGGAALADLLERHRATVRAFYDEVLGRAAQPAIDAQSPDLWTGPMNDEALRDRLRASGFAEPDAVLRPVRMIRRLLRPAAASPALRRALRRSGSLLAAAAARARNPGRAVGNLERLLSTLAAEPERLQDLLEHRELLGPTLQLLGRSDLLAGLLIRQPSILRRLEDRSRILRTPDAAEYRAALAEPAAAPGEPRARAAILRRRHQEALATIAIRDINRQATVREVLKSLSSLADAAIEGAALLARDVALPRGGPGGGEPRLALLGLGRLGYREMDYGSDLDLVFVSEGGVAGQEADEAPRRASGRWCEEIVRILSTLSREGQLYKVDLRLRPSGGEGDLVTTLSALRDYFRGPADVWEMQAFLKARPVAGDLELGRRAIAEVESAVLDRAAVMGPAAIASAVDAMRGRLAKEASKQGDQDPDLKLGEGGMLDIHFALECLQLIYAVRGPADKDTVRMLTLLNAGGRLRDEHLRVLYEAYLFLRALDHEMRLIHDRPCPRLPRDPARLEEVALALDPDAGNGGDAAARLFDTLAGHRAAVRQAYEAIVRGA